MSMTLSVGVPSLVIQTLERGRGGWPLAGGRGGSSGMTADYTTLQDYLLRGKASHCSRTPGTGSTAQDVPQVQRIVRGD